MDPCLFVIVKHGKRSWLLCFVDDIDCASEDIEHAEEIFSIMNKEWPCKEVSNDFMLGVKRTRVKEEGTHKITLSMEAYVEGMYNNFLPYINTRHSSTPSEPSLLLTLHNDSKESEHKTVRARGYQRAVGMILWASRGVFPQTLYTVAQLCKMMSKVFLESWTFYRTVSGLKTGSTHNG